MRHGLNLVKISEWRSRRKVFMNLFVKKVPPAGSRKTTFVQNHKDPEHTRPPCPNLSILNLVQDLYNFLRNVWFPTGSKNV